MINSYSNFAVQVGFRMVRATHGVHNGPYFWECEILKPSTKNSHVRVGWSTRFGELQAPVGFDKCSYAYCDVTGTE
jgi:Set1/Ash2 histone methyltransferase complex subunit ASH2